MFLCIIAQNVNFPLFLGAQAKKKKKKSQGPLCVLKCVMDMFINVSSITSYNSL